MIAGTTSAFERTLPEGAHLLVKLTAERGDTVLRHPLQAQLLDQTVDLARRDAVDVRLQHHGHDRLLAPPPRLEEAREVGWARAGARDRELDLSHPRLPLARPVAVAVRPSLRAHLAASGADLSRDLRLHQLARDELDRLAQEVARLAGEHLGNDIGNGHAVVLGHRGAPFVDRLGRQPTSLEPAVAGLPSDYRGAATPLLPTRPRAPG